MPKKAKACAEFGQPAEQEISLFHYDRPNYYDFMCKFLFLSCLYNSALVLQADRDTFYKGPPLVANFHVEPCGCLLYRVSTLRCFHP